MNLITASRLAKSYQVIEHRMGHKAIHDLFAMLQSHSLDPTWEGMDLAAKDPADDKVAPFRGRAWGNCKSTFDPAIGGMRYFATEPIHPEYPNAVRFSGNFMEISFGFSVDTADQSLIDDLDAAIEQNMKMPAYIEAKNRIVKRKFASEAQREVRLLNKHELDQQQHLAHAQMLDRLEMRNERCIDDYGVGSF